MKTRTKRKLLALGLCIVVFSIGVAIMTVTGLDGPLPMSINAALVLTTWRLVPKGDDNEDDLTGNNESNEGTEDPNTASK